MIGTESLLVTEGTRGLYFPDPDSFFEHEAVIGKLTLGQPTNYNLGRYVQATINLATTGEFGSWDTTHPNQPTLVQRDYRLPADPDNNFSEVSLRSTMTRHGRLSRINTFTESLKEVFFQDTSAGRMLYDDVPTRLFGRAFATPSEAEIPYLDLDARVLHGKRVRQAAKRIAALLGIGRADIHTSPNF